MLGLLIAIPLTYLLFLEVDLLITNEIHTLQNNFTGNIKQSLHNRRTTDTAVVIISETAIDQAPTSCARAEVRAAECAHASSIAI